MNKHLLQKYLYHFRVDTLRRVAVFLGTQCFQSKNKQCIAVTTNLADNVAVLVKVQMAGHAFAGTAVCLGL